MYRKSNMHKYLKSMSILLLNWYENGYLVRLKNWCDEAGFVLLKRDMYSTALIAIAGLLPRLRSQKNG